MRTLLASLLVLAAGCGGPGSFSGKVQGTSLAVKEAVFFVQALTISNPAAPVSAHGNTIAMVLSDTTDSCSKLQNNQNIAGQTALAILFTVTQGNLDLSSDLATGDYRHFSAADFAFPPVAGTKLIFPSFHKYGSQCEDTLGAPTQGLVSTSGQATVDDFAIGAGKHMRGSFHLNFDNDVGDGSFDATYCDVPSLTAAPACS